MSYNSKNLRAVAEVLQFTNRPSLSEGACKYEQKEATYFNPFPTDMFSSFLGLIIGN